MTRKIEDSVVVITGASSGIGRASALAFAEQGATVVLAARREPALHEVAEQCTRLGGRAHVVRTDVTDEQQVQHLAREVIERFGRIDTWVNNAAVTLFARFEEAPLDVYRRVIETNFLGTVYGARAALPYFHEQGSGTLINVASIVGETGQPYTSAYVASKAAILGFTESLRMELSLDGAKEIQACAVIPATVDTPLFQHAANYTGRAAKAMNPVYPATDVAEAIVSLARKPKREARIGAVPRVALMQRVLMPWMMERSYSRMVDQDHLADEAAEPTNGNVFEPMAEWASVGGDWLPADASPPSRVPKLAVPAAGAGAIAAGVFALRRLRSSRDGDGSHGGSRGGSHTARDRRDDRGLLQSVMRQPAHAAAAVGRPVMRRFR